MKTINIDACVTCPHSRKKWIKNGQTRMDQVITCKLLNGSSNCVPRTYFVIKDAHLGIPKQCKLKGTIENEVEEEIKYT